MTSSSSNYLFIDAGYLRRVLHDKLELFVGRHVDMRLDYLLLAFQAQRAFYYECLDEERRPAESEAETATRIRTQTDELTSINSLPGFFVRLGSLRGIGARRRQKEIDVLLAVDMLTHAHSRNMSRAVLIAGDLDFKPVVEALVQQGTMVTVVNEARSSSRELAAAADTHQALDLRTLWKMTSGPWDAALSDLLPTEFAYSGLPKSQPIRVGTFEGKEVRMYFEDSRFKIVLPVTQKTMLSIYWQHQDQQMLERFVEIEFGPVTWS